MKIALAGNQWISQYLLQAMCQAGFIPSVVINLASAKSDKISGYIDLAPICERYNIPVFRPKSYSLKNVEDQEGLSKIEIDLLIVFGWQRLIPEWLIDQCKLGVYGVHGGPEKPPRCRGRAVFNWAIFLGASRFYMYLFRITPEVDAGPIVKMVEFDITPRDDIASVYHKNCIVSSRMIIESLPSIFDGSAVSIEQDNTTPTYLPKREPKNGGIFWDWSADRISRLVKAVTKPYPGAFTYLDGKEVTVFEADPFDSKITFAGAPGTILEVFPNDDLLVQCQDQAIYVRDWECSDRELLAKGKVFDLRSGEHLEDPQY